MGLNPSKAGREVYHYQIVTFIMMVTQLYFQQTSGIHIPVGNLNILG